MPKRSQDDIDIESLVQSVPLDKGLVDGLQQLNCHELTAVLAHVANVANISTVAFKKTRIELPSFSVWSAAECSEARTRTFHDPQISPSAVIA